MWYMHELGGWGMLWGGLLMLVFWGGLISLVVWGIIRLTRRDEKTTRNAPLEIAKERYARGEITKEQFEQIKKDVY